MVRGESVVLQIDGGEGVGKTLEGALADGLGVGIAASGEFTFPYGDGMPAHGCELLLHLLVALLVALNLFYPEWAVGMWYLAAFGVLEN